MILGTYFNFVLRLRETRSVLPLQKDTLDQITAYCLYPFMYAHSLHHPSAFCLDVLTFLHFSLVKHCIIVF